MENQNPIVNAIQVPHFITYPPTVFFSLLKELTVNDKVECNDTNMCHDSADGLHFQQTFRVKNCIECAPKQIPWGNGGGNTPNAIAMAKDEFLRNQPLLHKEGTQLWYAVIGIDTTTVKDIIGIKPYVIYNPGYAEHMSITMYYIGSDGEMYRHVIMLAPNEVAEISKQKRLYIKELIESMFKGTELASEDFAGAMHGHIMPQYYEFLQIGNILQLGLDFKMDIDGKFFSGKRIKHTAVLTHNLSRYEPMFRHNEKLSNVKGMGKFVFMGGDILLTYIRIMSTSLLFEE